MDFSGISAASMSALMNMQLQSSNLNTNTNGAPTNNKWANAGINLADTFGQYALGNKQYANTDSEAAAQSRAATRSTLSSMGGKYGKLIATADTLVDATGGYSDVANIRRTVGGANSKAKGNAQLGTTLLSHLPFAGYFGKKQDTFTLSDQLNQSTGYADTKATAQAAASNSGGKFFGRRINNTINSQRENAINQQNIVNGIMDKATDDILAKDTMSTSIAQNNLFNLQGGLQTNMLRAAKDGMKFEDDDAFVDQLYSNYLQQQENAFVDELYSKALKFQDGGTMNLIPEGALHAHKHHMEDDEHITKKGIPVVDNDGKQQAEIERNEVIFRLEVTQQLEELRDKYNEAKKNGGHYNKFAIEAGKLLTYELLQNTEDRTGLIKETK